MFLPADGPTALRPDLVRALAFSLRDAQIDTPDGPRMARCGVAGVWNESKGAVVVVMRHLDPPLAQRYAFSEPINTPKELEQAVETGLAFVESMGFMVDGPEFRELEDDERAARIKAWNALRKLRKPAAAPGSATGSGSAVPTPAPPDANAESAAIEPESPASDLDIPADRAVLGRISLVQREDRERWRISPFARLRSFF